MSILFSAAGFAVYNRYDEEGSKAFEKNPLHDGHLLAIYSCTRGMFHAVFPRDLADSTFDKRVFDVCLTLADLGNKLTPLTFCPEIGLQGLGDANAEIGLQGLGDANAAPGTDFTDDYFIDRLLPALSYLRSVHFDDTLCMTGRSLRHLIDTRCESLTEIEVYADNGNEQQMCERFTFEDMLYVLRHPGAARSVRKDMLEAISSNLRSVAAFRKAAWDADFASLCMGERECWSLTHRPMCHPRLLTTTVDALRSFFDTTVWYLEDRVPELSDKILAPGGAADAAATWLLDIDHLDLHRSVIFLLHSLVPMPSNDPTAAHARRALDWAASPASNNLLARCVAEIHHVGSGEPGRRRIARNAMEHYRFSGAATIITHAVAVLHSLARDAAQQREWAVETIKRLGLLATLPIILRQLRLVDNEQQQRMRDRLWARSTLDKRWAELAGGDAPSAKSKKDGSGSDSDSGSAEEAAEEEEGEDEAEEDGEAEEEEEEEPIETDDDSDDGDDDAKEVVGLSEIAFRRDRRTGRTNVYHIVNRFQPLVVTQPALLDIPLLLDAEQRQQQPSSEAPPCCLLDEALADALSMPVMDRALADKYSLQLSVGVVAAEVVTRALRRFVARRASDGIDRLVTELSDAQRAGILRIVADALLRDHDRWLEEKGLGAKNVLRRSMEARMDDLLSVLRSAATTPGGSVAALLAAAPRGGVSAKALQRLVSLIAGAETGTKPGKCVPARISDLLAEAL